VRHWLVNFRPFKFVFSLRQHAWQQRLFFGCAKSCCSWWNNVRASCFKLKYHAQRGKHHKVESILKHHAQGGRDLPKKPTKVTLLTMVLYNSKSSIRDMRPFFHPLFCHNSVVKYTSPLLQQWTRNETWLRNITEIPPSSLTGWIHPWSCSCYVEIIRLATPNISNLTSDIRSTSLFPGEQLHLT